MELTEEAKEYLIKKGSNLDYGARPLRRALEQRVEDPLAEELLRGTFEGKDTITIAVVKDDEGKIVRLDFRGEIQRDKSSNKFLLFALATSLGACGRKLCTSDRAHAR